MKHILIISISLILVFTVFSALAAEKVEFFSTNIGLVIR